MIWPLWVLIIFGVIVLPILVGRFCGVGSDAPEPLRRRNNVRAVPYDKDAA